MIKEIDKQEIKKGFFLKFDKITLSKYGKIFLFTYLANWHFELFKSIDDQLK